MHNWISFNIMSRFHLKRIQVTLHHLLKNGFAQKCSKFLLAFQDRYVDEAEFKTSGGVSGYIARAKNLMDTRKLYTEAIGWVSIFPVKLKKIKGVCSGIDPYWEFFQERDTKIGGFFKVLKISFDIEWWRADEN